MDLEHVVKAQTVNIYRNHWDKNGGSSQTLCPSTTGTGKKYLAMY